MVGTWRVRKATGIGLIACSIMYMFTTGILWTSSRYKGHMHSLTNSHKSEIIIYEVCLKNDTINNTLFYVLQSIMNITIPPFLNHSKVLELEHLDE